MSEEMRYIYFGDKRSFGAPVVCAGYKIDGDKIIYGVSFCSPKDRFSRKQAHLILNGRHGKNKVERIQSPGHNPRYEDVATLIKSDIQRNIVEKGSVGRVPKPMWFTSI